MNIFRYYHTIKYLRLVQILYLVRNRICTIFHAKIKHLSNLPNKPGYPLDLKPFIAKPVSYNSGTFVFLNLSKTYAGNINWDEIDYGRLWTYNLNYMDFLLQPGVDAIKGSELISDFIKNSSRNKVWTEPYTISLRGINWIKFLSRHNIRSEITNQFLYQQYTLLQKSIEYHLLGNHLLENGFSLLFASWYFRERAFYIKAVQILQSQLSEQVLDDGGHYERSPMYHMILLDRMLDCINLVQNNSEFPDSLKIGDQLIQKASEMVAWLKYMTYSNGDIPLFNDASRFIAPDSSALIAYSESLNLPHTKCIPGKSGYRKIQTIAFEAFFDFGSIGPDYIPGHAHADTFNFELYDNKGPLIIDTGISTYENNSLRHYERSTRAHNTVEVNSSDSSEVWSSFRVARRAHITELTEENNRMRGIHNGYKKFGILVERNIEWGDQHLKICDLLHSKKSVPAFAYFHFSPSVKPFIDNQSVIFPSGRIEFEGAISLFLDECQIGGQYNHTIKSQVLRVQFTKELYSTFTFIN